MNSNDFQKVVHAAIWYNNKILLSQRLKKGFHHGFWSDPGGKLDGNELPVIAVARELEEETGLCLSCHQFYFIDCFIYPERKIKTFIFEANLERNMVSSIKNIEPEKHSDWKFFTKHEALKLKLMPSVRYYLESL